METLKIKAILCAIKNKSLSRAAEEFLYTPSAFSHMADSLEDELGVKLINRTPMGVELTEEGEELYSKLEAVINAENELMRAAQEISKQYGQTLRIGTYSSISLHVLPELLKLFKQDYPEVSVSIVVGNNLRRSLDEGEVDIIFADTGAFGKNEWVPFMNDPYVALAPTSLLKGRKTVQREELYAYTYIATVNSALHDYFGEEKFCEIIKFDSVDDASVISMVKEEIGIAVLPSLAVKNHVKGVHTLQLEPKLSRTLGFAYKKSSDFRSGKEKFIKFVKNNVSQIK